MGEKIAMLPPTPSYLLCHDAETEQEGWGLGRKDGNSYFFQEFEKGDNNNFFLLFQISCSPWNCALQHMTPTYSEHIRLLGQSSWEEIDFLDTQRERQTERHSDRQTAHRTLPTFSLALTIYVLFHFYTNGQYILPSFCLWIITQTASWSV